MHRIQEERLSVIVRLTVSMLSVPLEDLRGTFPPSLPPSVRFVSFLCTNSSQYLTYCLFKAQIKIFFMWVLFDDRELQSKRFYVQVGNS